jgi:hypothetical protein
MGAERSYAQVEDFVEYSGRDAWIGYIEETVVPLWESAVVLKQFHNRLEQEFDGRWLEELANEERQLFLGGVDPDRENVYPRDSVAKFYDLLFGAGVADLQSWVLSEGDGVQTEVLMEVGRPQFIEFAKMIHDQLTGALASQALYRDWREPEVDFVELLEHPEQLRNLVEEFYQQVLDFVANHSYPTYFLFTVNQVPRYFAKQAYPDFDDETSMVRDEFGVTTLDWNCPIKPDADIFQDYEILCFPEYDESSDRQSFGGAIVAMNEAIWMYFDDHSYQDFRAVLGEYFNQVPNLREQYQQRVEPRVTEVPDDWIGGRFNIYFKGLSASAESRSEAENSRHSIMELLDLAAPILFLGLNKIDSVYEDRLQFTRMGD